MSKIKKLTDNDELDRSFKLTLGHTEAYLKRLKNIELVEIVLKWLDRLSHLKHHRYLRNQYLNELFRQLKSGSISDIFLKPPPRTDLPLLTYQNNTVMFI